MPLILGTNSIKDTGYNVANSVRFNRSDDSYMSRTFGTPTNRKKFTVSFWIKRSNITISGGMALFGSDGGSSSYFSTIHFNPTDDLCVGAANGGPDIINLVTDRKFRDVGAWYHICVIFDSTQGTDTNRVKVYVNGIQETSFSSNTYPSQNDEFFFNQGTKVHSIGKFPYGTDVLSIDGYISEFVFIDGTTTSISDFGEFDSDSPNIWKPKDVSGLTFGNNGCYLDFADSGDLDDDESGNGNDFTATNVAATDQSTDTCTNNFCTFTTTHPSAANFTLSEGNLKVVKSAAFTGGLSGSSIMPTTGKWYFEALINEAGNGDRTRVGVINYSTQVENNDTGTLNKAGSSLSGVTTSCKSAKHFETVNGSTTEYTNSGNFADGDIIQFAMDLDNKAIYIGRNGTFLTQSGSSGGDPTSGASKTGAISTNTTIMNGEPMSAFLGHSAGQSDQSDISFNFGSPPYSISSGNSDANGYGNFEYSVPSGYYSLNTKNLAEFG